MKRHGMDLIAHFGVLAEYNRIANERLFTACAQLEDSEYRRARAGSFGSIHALLNHILLGDQIWMSRFEGRGHETPPLDKVLFEEFSSLRAARIKEDDRIKTFFELLPDGFLSRSFRYMNNRGIEYLEPAPIAVSHFFNHQTHHRGQVHVMLSQTAISPPSLDLHRIINP